MGEASQEVLRLSAFIFFIFSFKIIDTLTVFTILYIIIIIIPMIILYRVLSRHKHGERRSADEDGDEEEEKSLM